jgi:tetratricopeptide (TPR) repeat protein
LKLHGDYLYSTLRNTRKELKAQDPNMERQVIQVLGQYGLVVVGYSGGDESVMKVLKNISRKNDLYWCVLEGSEINASVEKLLEAKRGSIIEIQGFDEMMNEIREIVGFDVRRMFGSIQRRQDRIIEKIKDFAYEYGKDILAEIVEALTEEQKLADDRAKMRIADVRCLDKLRQARIARLGGDYPSAEAFYLEAIQINPEYKQAHNELGIVLEDMERPGEAEEAYRKEIEVNSEDSNAYSNLMKLLRSLDRNTDALEIGEKALTRKATSFETFISLVAIHMGLGNTSEAEIYAIDARKLIDQLIAPNSWYQLASLECVSGNKDAAIENLKRAKRAAEEGEGFDRPYAKKDLDFLTIRDDPRFREIVDE